MLSNYKKELLQDLIAGRGDWKSNISKITYYGRDTKLNI